MVCIGKNIANCRKDPQFLPVMCALCQHVLYPVKLFPDNDPVLPLVPGTWSVLAPNPLAGPVGGEPACQTPLCAILFDDQQWLKTGRGVFGKGFPLVTIPQNDQCVWRLALAVTGGVAFGPTPMRDTPTWSPWAVCKGARVYPSGPAGNRAASGFLGLALVQFGGFGVGGRAPLGATVVWPSYICWSALFSNIPIRALP